MKSKSYKTTKVHFKIFKVECEKWLDFFQLRSWDVSYLHENGKVDVTWAGWCNTSWLDRTATLGLAKTWNIRPEKYEVRKTAFHEVCELLLSRLHIEAIVDRCLTEKDNIAEQRHAIIRRLEHAIFK